LQESLNYTTVPSALGTFCILWRDTPERPRVHRLLLPEERVPAAEVLRVTLARSKPQSCPQIRELADQIRSYLKGDAVRFRLSLVDFTECSDFQKKVLLAQYKVPRGRVSTYGGIALGLGVPNAARAVGTALARNPFPIIIPCHRTIRSNGDLGGFGGGLEMKRALLQLEGVDFSTTGKVLAGRL
jgi:methylated-DNA-[protein]-cysteine S-methyltransferase